MSSKLLILNGDQRPDRTARPAFSGPPSNLTKWSGISGYYGDDYRCALLNLGWFRPYDGRVLVVTGESPRSDLFPLDFLRGEHAQMLPQSLTGHQCS
jgi:hypothetical protein